ncbi:MAG: hypothetical protein FWD85_04210 [Microbacteriaceae bacterium]|nr:hypothetical protein [Microbacteriaceae bacterium]MCL2794492.1 hypothetical protein [Microbacteriaceae bacterium]
MPHHPDDDLAALASDDALLDAIAMRAAGDAATQPALPDGDPAAALLMAVVAEVGEAAAPVVVTTTGTARRRLRRGVVPGVTLGVAFALFAGGTLAAAAEGRLPSPAQAVVGRVVAPFVGTHPHESGVRHGAPETHQAAVRHTGGEASPLPHAVHGAPGASRADQPHAPRVFATPPASPSDEQHRARSGGGPEPSPTPWFRAYSMTPAPDHGQFTPAPTQSPSAAPDDRSAPAAGSSAPTATPSPAPTPASTPRR